MKNILLICVLLAGLILPGCENNEILLSEKKLNSSLKGTWKIVAPRPKDVNEFWTFSDGIVSITFTNSNNVIQTVSGTYSVDAKFSKAYINLGGFSFTNSLNSTFTANDLNRKWTLVELNNGVLYISATVSSGAIRSMEFIKG